MKILMLTVDFIPHRDGVSTLSYHYARRLAAQGHEVHVVAPGASEDRLSDRHAPYACSRFPGYRLGRLRFLPFVAWSTLAVVRMRPELVLAMNIGYGGIVCLCASLLSKHPYITMAYAFEFLKVRKSALLRAVYRKIYERSLLTVAVSRYTRQQLIEFRVPADRIRVVYPGVSCARQDPPTRGVRREASANSMCVLGTCGRLIRRKGHDTVLRALPAISEQHSGIEYRIAGDGPERESLECLARELGVAERVRFLGRIDANDLGDFYRSLDLFVMPSRQDSLSGHVEGFGIVYLEAAAHGVPSVGSATGGVPEAIVDGVTGCLVSQDSPSELAGKIAALLHNPDRLRAMGEAAYERACRDFQWDSQVDAFSALLSQRMPPRETHLR